MVQIKSRTKLKQPIDMTAIKLMAKSGTYKAKLVQIDYFVDSMEVIRFYFKISDHKKPDNYAVWSAFNLSGGQYKAQSIVRALNGSNDMSKDYKKGQFNDKGDICNVHDPLGKSCCIQVYCNDIGPFGNGKIDVCVVIPDGNKGEYYV